MRARYYGLTRLLGARYSGIPIHSVSSVWRVFFASVFSKGAELESHIYPLGRPLRVPSGFSMFGHLLQVRFVVLVASLLHFGLLGRQGTAQFVSVNEIIMN